MNLTNLFAAGLRVKSLVDSVIQLQSPVYSILEHIVRVRQSIILASNKTEKSAWEDLAVKLLRKYYLMIAVGLYLHEAGGHAHGVRLVQLHQHRAHRPVFERELWGQFGIYVLEPVAGDFGVVARCLDDP